MNRKTLEKLAELATAAESISQDYEFDRWSARVQTFLATAAGVTETKMFLSLKDYMWPDTLALRLGYLEGLIALRASPGQTARHDASEIKESRKIFVVHGRDEAAKEGVARFIENVGLLPIILHEQANAGRTIIEKFEIYSDDVAFAVVLLTPDDVGSAAEDVLSAKSRARQNVIMELGYFIGRLGRSRVCALHKGNVELPSDYQGVVYIEMDVAGAWKAKLAQEFVQARISINLPGLLGA